MTHFFRRHDGVVSHWFEYKFRYLLNRDGRYTLLNEISVLSLISNSFSYKYSTENSEISLKRINCND